MRGNLFQSLQNKILVLDGAMGTLIQQYNLEEKDYRGERFKYYDKELKGNNDLLTLTRSSIIKEIHSKYLEAGADIIETNTFNSNIISQADYNMESLVYELNFEAAKLARKVADEFSTADKPRFVAGSIGPTNKSLSMSEDVDNPGARSVSFDKVCESYEEQIRGLIDGGADILLIETIFDPLNARAAIYAAENIFEEKCKKLPIMISVTANDKEGRLLSGQTLEAFYYSIKNENIISIGMNCSFGGKDLIPLIRDLSDISEYYISIHPNAGLPNVLGEYDEGPEQTASYIETLAKESRINIVGGCCGTTPSHIKAISEVVKKYKPREKKNIEKESVYCGLEALKASKTTNFINVGERCNVAGSRKFARLIREKNYDEAINIAREMVSNGAQIVDVNFDDGLLDAKEEMEYFLRLIGSEPEICAKPIMIDSSKWEVLTTGLKSIAGKVIVNSISLKNGEEEFIREAKEIKKFNAATVVMAFDEQGQADTYERKIQVCKRAYDILVNKVKFPAEDIIFDPNILAIATGMEEHDNYGVDFIKATKWIKENLPYAKVSGGVSNLSFSFRGNNPIREAMHSVFLYHAINAGMDMGIVNPGMIMIYDDIPKDLLTLVEDVVLNKDNEAATRLLEKADSFRENGEKKDEKVLKWRELSLEERISYSLVKGIDKYVEEDMKEAYEKYDKPLSIIEGPLMDAMSEVGRLFGDGKMFLPQVVKSARVMKKSVSYIMPYIEEESSGEASKRGKVLLATVKGDVHDIGKNIVSVVLACNNLEVIDLGVMVPCEEIIEKAIEENVDAIGLSGLITPSLDEMIKVAKELENNKLNIPLIVGGATTSKTHTALKIDPNYSGLVIHGGDASRTVEIMKEILSEDKENYKINVKKEYKALRENYKNLSKKLLPLEEIKEKGIEVDFNKKNIVKPNFLGIKEVNYSIEDLKPYIDWSFLFVTFGLKGVYPNIFEDEKYGKAAKELYEEANNMLIKIENENWLKPKGIFGLFKGASNGDEILIYDDENILERFPMFRMQSENKDGLYKSLVDYLPSKESNIEDYIGAFLVTAGVEGEKRVESLKKDGLDYEALLLKALMDRIGEAFAEKLHEDVRKKYWGYAKDESLSIKDIFKGKYRGIRPAFGYPCLRDNKQIEKVMNLLDKDNVTGIRLTENYMMYPTSSVCGLYFGGEEDKYFDIYGVDENQAESFAKLSGENLEDIKRRLSGFVK